MNGQPKLTTLYLWDEFERRCLHLLREALVTLAAEPDDTREIDLNRKLYFAITSVARQMTEWGPFFPSPILESRSLPAAADVERAERESKMPDIYWAYTNNLPNDDDDANKKFVVECKRLTDPDDVYGRRYVRHGIDRFVNVNHNYSKGMPSGAMVGYLQKVLVDDAIISVDTVTTQDSIPPLVLHKRQDERCAELAHTLTRPTPEPPLRLTHIWGRIGPVHNP